MPYMPNSVYVHPSIQSPQDLQGKVLGTSTYGSNTHVALRAAFERWGLDEGCDVRSCGPPACPRSGPPAVLADDVQGVAASVAHQVAGGRRIPARCSAA
jgi:ABC-type nitrate/sulfonate/bicarbonate transport system substrate-binding protein